MSKREENVSVAEIWRKAQVALYELDTPRAITLLEHLLKAQGAAQDKGYDAVGFQDSRSGLLKVIEQLKLPEHEIDFKHPAIWVPFILTGYGGLVFS